METASRIPPSAQRLKDKMAIVTGGASGVGESTARLFADHGAKVIIADINADKGESLTNEINSNGGAASYIHCDVTSESDVAAAVAFATSNHGKLDIMYCNAGIFGPTNDSPVNVKSDDFKRVIDVNVYGSFLGAKHAADAMIPEKRGVILFTSSIASVMGSSSPVAYTASKHAVVGLMKSLAVQLGPHGIRVNCVAPCPLATPLLTAAMGTEDRGKLEEVMEEAAVLKGVVPKEEDIAQAALFLVSDEAKYVSGVNLVVDGGYTTTNPSYYRAVRESLYN